MSNPVSVSNNTTEGNKELDVTLINTRLFFLEKGKLRLDACAVPDVGPEEVLISMKCVGICGTDIGILKTGRIGTFEAKEPFPLGHEASGMVVKCGTGVTDLKPGDKVAIETGPPCGHCELCLEGRYNLCPISDSVFGHVSPQHGCISSFYVHPAAFCHRLPAGMSYEEGALLEPLSVGIHANNRAGLRAGDNLLICGSGTIGLVSMLVAKTSGASVIVMTDTSEKRLQIARKLGATHTIHVTSNNNMDVVAEIVSKVGHQVDKAIDCCGLESTLNIAIQSVKPGGTVCLVGMCGASQQEVSIAHCITREITLIGSFRYPNCYRRAVEMVASGRVDPMPLVTHRFPQADYINAFAAARSEDAVKVMFSLEAGESHRC